jgi:GTP-binding protein Era
MARERLAPFLSDFEDVSYLDGSAKTGVGTTGLKALLWDQLKDHPPYFPFDDSVSDRPMRYFVAEKIREQLFFELRDEIPYSAGVVVDEYEEGSDVHKIQATVVISREGHKSIVIGKGGDKIKTIGIRARRALEQFLGVHVYLNLRVKVSPDWMHNEREVRRIAYGGLT